MVGVETAASGAALCLLAGILNGSWALTVKETSPRFLRAVTRSGEPISFAWEHAWLCVMGSTPVLNLIFVLAIAGAHKPFEAIANTPATTIIAIAVSSILWGIGCVGLGRAMEILGVALGTTLVLSTIIICGTGGAILFESVTAARALGISGAVIAAVFGLVFSACAGLFRAHAYADKVKEAICSGLPMEDGNDVTQASSTAPQQSNKPTCIDTADKSENSNAHGGAADDGATFEMEDGNAVTEASVTAQHLGKIVCIDGAVRSVHSEAYEAAADNGAMLKVNISSPSGHTGKTHSNHTFYLGVLWAIIGGILCTGAQMSFIFGDRLRDSAEELGLSGPAADAPIWLLAVTGFSFGNVAFATFKILGNWRKVGKSPLTDQAAGSWRLHPAMTICALAKCVFGGSCIVGHLHIYGQGAAAMGSEGAVFAWPALMSSTVLTSQLWSFALGEWSGAGLKAHACNAASIFALIMSVVCTSAASTL